MRYQAVAFEFGPETLSRLGDDWRRRWQETVDDAQGTFSRALTVASPMDALSLQVAFGLRNAQRWLGYADRDAAESSPASAPAAAAADLTDAAGTGEPPVMPAEIAADAPLAAEPAAPDVPVAEPFVAEPFVAEASPEPAEPEPEPSEPSPEPSEPATPSLPIAAAAPDDLQRIRGIGPAIAAKLQARGIDSFAQMAALSEEEVAELDAALDLKGRIERDDWVAQAQSLSTQP